MAFPRTPGGLFPLTTAPTGNNAGGQFPTTDRLRSSFLALSPTAYWPMSDVASPLSDVVGGFGGTVTGSPTYAAAAPSPIAKGVTWSGTGQYALTSNSITAPTASVSVAVLFKTSASGATQALVCRYTAAQPSWQLLITSGGLVQFIGYQSGGAAHVTIGTSSTYNDGQWHLAVGTFDGTTAAVMVDAETRRTSTSLTGSWNKSPTMGVSIAGSGGGFSLLTGSTAHAGYWVDRVVTDAERLWLRSIVAGA